MNLTRRFCRASHLRDLFSRNYLTSDTNSIISIYSINSINSSAKSFILNFYKSHTTMRSLYKEMSVLPKKRLNKKKKFSPEEISEGLRIAAFSSAEEYNLEHLSLALPRCTAYETSTFGSDFGIDVVHARRNLKIESECQDLFFFREGCVVMWNFEECEVKNMLNFLKPYQTNGFADDLVKNESEVISYSVSDNITHGQILKDCVLLPAATDELLNKYAVSNAISLSVRLGAYEANLEQYIDTMAPVTEDLKSGNKIRMTRNEVLQKTGQLFALRHNINLNSDLLDTPDFYWDREELESLYQATFNYFCISKRTKVINEKINHCIELVELLSSHLNDKHHVRLEWMIIVLIMVEVAFEVCHYIDRYMESKNK